MLPTYAVSGSSGWTGGERWTEIVAKPQASSALEGWGAELIGHTLECLTMSPLNPDVLYAGTASRGVFKSTSGGASWTASASGMRSSEEIKAIVVNPRQPGVVYAGSYASGIYTSTNGGSSWALANNGLRNRAIRSLAVSADGNVVYAGTFGEGVYRLGR